MGGFEPRSRALRCRLDNAETCGAGAAQLLPCQNCYVFDELTRGELDRQRRLAKTMGSILDDSEVTGVQALTWIVADPCSKQFGKALPHELLEDVITLGQHGLVQWEDEVVYLQEIPDDQVEKFKEERKDATGDIRTLGDHRDPQGKRVLNLQDAADALPLMTEIVWMIGASPVLARSRTIFLQSEKVLVTCPPITFLGYVLHILPQSHMSTDRCVRPSGWPSVRISSM